MLIRSSLRLQLRNTCGRLRLNAQSPLLSLHQITRQSPYATQQSDRKKNLLRTPSQFANITAPNVFVDESRDQDQDQEWNIHEHQQQYQINESEVERDTVELNDLNRLEAECRAESAWKLFQKHQKDCKLSVEEIIKILSIVGRFGFISNTVNYRIQILTNTIIARLEAENWKQNFNQLIRILTISKQFDLAQKIIYDLETGTTAGRFDKLSSLESGACEALIGKMISNGKTEQAMSLFKYIRSNTSDANSGGEDVISEGIFSAFIRGFSLAGDVNNAISFIEAKVKAGHKPRLVDYQIVLRALFDNGLVDAAEQWYLERVQPTAQQQTTEVSVESELELFATMIRGYGKEQSTLEKCGEWFDLFLSKYHQQGGVKQQQPSNNNNDSKVLDAKRRVWNAMIIVYSQHQMAEDASIIFRKMRQLGIEPDALSCNSLIYAFSSSKDIEMAKSIFEHLPNWNIRPNKYTYTMLVDAFMKSGRVEEAVEWVDRMQKDECSPDNYLFTAMADGYHKNRMYNHSVEVYEDMKRMGVPLDIVTCNAVMFGAARRGDFDFTLRIYQDIKDRDLQLDGYTCNALICANAMNRDMEAAETIVEEMKERNIEMNIHTFNALIGGYLKNNNLEKAFDCVCEMKSRELQPTVGTYGLLMEMASMEGRCDNVLKYLNTLIKDKSVERISDYLVSSVVRILGRHGHVQIVQMTFDALLAGDDCNSLFSGGSTNGTSNSNNLKRLQSRIEVREQSWHRFIEVMIENDATEEAKQRLKQLFSGSSSDEALWWQTPKALVRLLEPFRKHQLWTELEELMAAIKQEDIRQDDSIET